MVPASTMEHFELRSGGANGIPQIFLGKSFKPVVAPLPNVAVHIVETPGIWFLLANGVGGSFAVVQIPNVLIGVFGVVAEAEKIGRSGAAGVFPLRFRRQSVAVARLEISGSHFAFCERGTVSFR